MSYRPKVFKCHIADFTTGADTVGATKDQQGRFILEDCSENKGKYEWIAELKTEHAHRAAEEFGRTLSCVGLTESEWLRLRQLTIFNLPVRAARSQAPAWERYPESSSFQSLQATPCWSLADQVPKPELENKRIMEQAVEW